ncbi:hypothetical protein D3C73_741860 [compost metagenome]
MLFPDWKDFTTMVINPTCTLHGSLISQANHRLRKNGSEKLWMNFMAPKVFTVTDTGRTKIRGS